MTIASDAVRISAGNKSNPTEDPRRAERPAKRILVVDDSAPMRAILRSMLLTDTSTSWEMAEAVSGADFLATISAQPAFDAILLDVQMPGMDGFTACRLFREQHGQIPVVFLTAEGDRRSFDQGRASGGDSYLAKPFSPAALKTVLHVLTDLRRCADGGTAAP